MQQFSLTNDPDAENARNQYDIIYEFSYYNRASEKFMKKVENFRKDPTVKDKNEVIWIHILQYTH